MHNLRSRIVIDFWVNFRDLPAINIEYAQKGLCKANFEKYVHVNDLNYSTSCYILRKFDWTFSVNYHNIIIIFFIVYNINFYLIHFITLSIYLHQHIPIKFFYNLNVSYSLFPLKTNDIIQISKCHCLVVRSVLLILFEKPYLLHFSNLQNGHTEPHL